MDLKILGRRHNLAACRGVVFLETTDLAAALRYVGQWNKRKDTSGGSAIVAADVVVYSR